MFTVIIHYNNKKYIFTFYENTKIIPFLLSKDLPVAKFEIYPFDGISLLHPRNNKMKLRRI